MIIHQVTTSPLQLLMSSVLYIFTFSFALNQVGLFSNRSYLLSLFMSETTLLCNIPYQTSSGLTYSRACGLLHENGLLCLAKPFIISLQSTYFPAVTCYVMETYCPLHKGSFHAVISFVLLCRKTEFQFGHSF